MLSSARTARLTVSSDFNVTAENSTFKLLPLKKSVTFNTNMATETEPKPIKTPPEKRDLSFTHLTNTLKRYGQPAHQAVAGYIRRTTSGKITNLAIYHAATDISDEDKYQTYKFCFNALVKKGGPDYELLKSIAKNAEDEAVEFIGQIVDESHEKRVKRSTTPAESADESPTVEVAEARDPLTKAILDVVMSHLRDLKVDHSTPKLDEERVDEIARGICADLRADIDDPDNFRDRVLKAMQNGAFPRESVLDMIDKTVGKLMENLPQRIILQKLDGSVKELEGRHHYKFPLLVAALSQRLNVALVGPAGSSKTTAAFQASKALEFEFEAISVGPMTSKADLLGFIDAGGKYHETSTVRRAVKGGIMLWDEFDAANASVATYGNMLLANEHFGTPRGMQAKHKDFCLVAGLNTYGMGANRVYVGRNQLDGATLDRFIVIDWDYDEGLEAAIIGCNRPSPKLTMDEGGILEADQWLDYVVKVRKACENLAIRHVVSPRASIHGTKLFLAGIGRTHVERMVLWKGLEEATVAKIKAAI